MRWEGRRQSENVEDRRGIGGPVLVGGGLITLLLMVAMMFLGFDPQMVAKIAPEIAGPQQQAPAKPINDEMTKMVKVVLADNEDVWGRLFPKHFRGRYAPPTLVLFSGKVQSAYAKQLDYLGEPDQLRTQGLGYEQWVKQTHVIDKRFLDKWGGRDHYGLTCDARQVAEEAAEEAVLQRRGRRQHPLHRFPGRIRFPAADQLGHGRQQPAHLAAAAARHRDRRPFPRGRRTSQQGQDQPLGSLPGGRRILRRGLTDRRKLAPAKSGLFVIRELFRCSVRNGPDCDDASDVGRGVLRLLDRPRPNIRDASELLDFPTAKNGIDT
jgi:hypothetical protein